MKIKVDEKDILELSSIQEKVIKNDIIDSEFQDDMIRRIKDAIENKYLNCFYRLKEEWDPKLEALGHTMIPTNKDEYAKLVFAQATYKDRSARERKDGN